MTDDVYIDADGRRVLGPTAAPRRGYVSSLWPPSADPSLAHPESSRPGWVRADDIDAFDDDCDDTDEERADEDSDDDDEPESRDLLIDLAEWRRDRGVR